MSVEVSIAVVMRLVDTPDDVDVDESPLNNVFDVGIGVVFVV